MTKTQLLAAVTGIILAIGPAASGALAQQGGQSRGMNIALIDISRVFKEYAHFNTLMSDLKTKIERADTEMKREAKELQDLAEELKGYKVGSPDYKRKEALSAQRQADFRVRVQLQRKEFLELEAKIYYDVYQGIEQEVEYYARNNNIVAVFRISSEEVDKDKPDEVLKEINKPVVWYHQGIDITNDVLAMLNQRSRTTQTRQGVPPNSGTRQR